MATYFSYSNFEHLEIKEKSVYAMICRTELKKDPNLIQKIDEFFSDNYEYFD
jgi:Mn-dependent DtxR family transcriptional regulator